MESKERRNGRRKAVRFWGIKGAAYWSCIISHAGYQCNRGSAINICYERLMLGLVRGMHVKSGLGNKIQERPVGRDEWMMHDEVTAG